MTMLQNWVRPTESFDPANRKHRALFAEFVRTGSWKHSPVRFVASEPTQVDVGTMTRQVVEFYIEKEFAKTAKNG
jgi:hypothetical protein